MPVLRTRFVGSKPSATGSAWSNTRETFGLRAQLFHAAIGLAVIMMLVVGFSLDRWPDSIRNQGYILHMGLGLWILLASVAWFAHWLVQPTPGPVPGQSRANVRVARLVHRLLLVLCIVMPVTGWVMASAWGNRSIAIAPFIHLPAVTYKDADFAKAMLGLHIVVAWAIVGLLALHLAGALYHHLIKRDIIVKRMIPRLSRLRRGARFDKGVVHSKFRR